MAFVIAAPCIADYSCVEVCPTQCIGPLPDDPTFDNTEQLYIDPTRCIDCEACVEACPVGAIYEATRLPPEWREYQAINEAYFRKKL